MQTLTKLDNVKRATFAIPADAIGELTRQSTASAFKLGIIGKAEHDDIIGQSQFTPLQACNRLSALLATRTR